MAKRGAFDDSVGQGDSAPAPEAATRRDKVGSAARASVRHGLRMVMWMPFVSSVLALPGCAESDAIEEPLAPAGLIVVASTGEASLTTTEAGGSASLTVSLASRPESVVRLALVSSNPAEGTVPVAPLEFTPESWSESRTVTVVGVGDAVADGDQPYEIVVTPESGDERYAALAPVRISARNLDDDVAGVSVTPRASLRTHELGASVAVDLVLKSEPRADVTLLVASDDVSEGRVAPATLRFTTADWSTPRAVIVTGVGEAGLDGSVGYAVALSVVSADPAYDALPLQPLSLLNEDFVVMRASQRGALDPDGAASGPVVSADGGVVAFESDATNLVPGDGNGARDVFVWTRATRALERVSVAGDGTEARGSSRHASLSADGMTVAFDSDAAGLVTGDTNGKTDVFLRRRARQETLRVSLNGARQVSGSSYEPSLSSSGDRVAFLSDAPDLAGKLAGFSDAYLRDVAAGTTLRLSVGNTKNALYARMAGDGARVAFSTIGALTPDAHPGFFDVFVREPSKSATWLASYGATGGSLSSGSGALSASGSLVAYESDADDVVPADRNGVGDVFVFDLASRITERLSVDDAGAEGNGASAHASLSGDGLLAVFESDADNLVSGDTNGTRDVFVRDRRNARTRRISLTSGGEEAQGPSTLAALSADGRWVAYVSTAANVVEGDGNGLSDVFVVRLDDALFDAPSR